MKLIDDVKKRVEKVISSHKSLAYVVNIQGRFNDQKGGLRVGSITYYMFMSMLPLLIVALTVFDIIFTHNPQLRKSMIDSTLSTVPVIGPTLESNLSFVKERGLTLVVTVLVLLWSVRGGALALEAALLAISSKEEDDRNFFSQTIRAYSTMALIGVGLFMPTLVSSLFSDHLLLQLLIFLIGCLWNALLVFLIFYILVDKKFAFGKGVVVGGIAISLVQFFSVFIVSRSLENARPLYGTLAVVLALLAWISLQVRIVLYAAIINSRENDNAYKKN